MVAGNASNVNDAVQGSILFLAVSSLTAMLRFRYKKQEAFRLHHRNPMVLKDTIQELETSLGKQFFLATTICSSLGLGYVIYKQRQEEQNRVSPAVDPKA